MRYRIDLIFHLISTYNKYLDLIGNNLLVRAYRFFLEKKSPVIRYNEWLADCKTYRISNRWSIASMYEILCLLYTVWPRFSGILHIQCRFFSIIKIIAFVWADICLNVKLWMLFFFTLFLVIKFLKSLLLSILESQLM